MPLWEETPERLLILSPHTEEGQVSAKQEGTSAS